MRCKNCDYPLWNLRSRTCPECGDTFAPSDYEFISNSVAFCCPHCDQCYYGTDDHGRLSPIAFDCVTCHNHLHLDEMVLRPAEGIEEKQTRVDTMPWLDRAHRGRLRGWISTVGMSMGMPNRLIRAVPEEGSIGQAWWFATVTWLVIFLAGVGAPLMGLSIVIFFTGGNDAVWFLTTGLLVCVAGPALSLLNIVIWGAITHGILKATGGANRSIGDTYQVFCYSSGPNIVQAFPCFGFYCGGYFVWMWWCVSAILMLVQRHRVHGGRASLAVLTLPILMLIISIGGLMYGFMTTVQTARAATAQVALTASVKPLVTALLDYSETHNGQGPTHPIELLETANITASDFIANDTLTTVDDVAVMDGSLEDYIVSNSTRQRDLIDAMTASIGDDPVAVRFGDFIFTYFGIDLTTADAKLWVVVKVPGTKQIGRANEYIVGHADGSFTSIPASPGSQFAQRLSAQNQLRKAAGLPALPADFSTLTHENPMYNQSEPDDPR